MSSIFPTIAEVIAIHDALISQLGGSPGLRDPGALESALLRPRLEYYDSLLEEAAAMLESLAMNHPFEDGNKRTAFFTTDTFLRQNGYFIACDNDAAYAYFMTLFETNSFRFAELKAWLEENIESLP